MPGYKPSFGGDTPRRRNLTIDVQRKPVSISAETMADIEQIRAVYRASTTENTGSRCALRRAARPGSALGLPPCAPLWLCSGPAAPLSARAGPSPLTLGAASPGPRGPAESLRTALICRAALPVAPPSPDALRPARSGGVKVEKSTGRNAFSFVRKAKPVDMDLSAAGIRSLTTKDRQKTQYASLRKVFKKMDSDGVRPSPSPGRESPQSANTPTPAVRAGRTASEGLRRLRRPGARAGAAGLRAGAGRSAGHDLGGGR